MQAAPDSVTLASSLTHCSADSWHSSLAVLEADGEGGGSCFRRTRESGGSWSGNPRFPLSSRESVAAIFASRREAHEPSS